MDNDKRQISKSINTSNKNNINKGSLNVKKIYLLLLLILILPIVTASYPTGYTLCKNITITNPTSETLTNFPINLNITYDADMQSDFDDLRFYNGSCGGTGGILLAELENKTDSTNTYLWINNNLTTGNNLISMYYGNTTNSNTWTTSNVWNTNYIGVWHSDNLLDSTSIKNNGTNSGATRSAGSWDGAYAYDGVNDIINISNKANYDDVPITYEMWIKSNSFGTGDHTILFQYNDTIQKIVEWNFRTKNTGELRWDRMDTSYTGSYINHTSLLLTGQTYYVVGEMNSSGYRWLYINGVLVSNGTFSNPKTNSTYKVAIGAQEANAYLWNGTIDEIRISNTERSNNWINATYQLINNNSGYISYGVEQTQISYYYNQTGGNDSNDCSTPALACKTIANLNTKIVHSGDTVYFATGEVWNCKQDDYIIFMNGSSTANLTYQSYGTGNKPVFTSMINSTNTANWTNISSTIWKSTFTINVDIGNLLFNNDTSSGVKHNSTIGITTQGDFYYNYTDDKVYIYSTNNPITHYGNIILTTEDDNVQRSTFQLDNGAYIGANNIVIKDLEFKYAGQGAIACNGDCRYIYILNNTVSWIGGAYQYTDNTRFGNAINFGLRPKKVDIKYNVVNQVFDACICPQGYTGSGDNMQNIEISYNIITNCHYGIEYFNFGGTIYNISINHNTILNSGGEWSNNQRGDTMISSGLRLAQSPSTTYNFTVKDNIIYNHTNTNMRFSGGSLTNWATGNFGTDYNLYYSKGSYGLISWMTSYYQTLASFQASNGNESHSIESNPLLASGTLIPASNSPACNMSTTGSYVGALACEPPDGDNVTPTLTLGTGNPINVTSSTGVVTFNWTASDLNLDSVSLYLNGILNYTNSTPLNGTPMTITLTLEQGYYTWFILAIDNAGNYVTTDMNNYVNYCTENWVSNSIECSAGSYTISYTDSNTCGTSINLPADNGSVASCGSCDTSTGRLMGNIILAMFILGILLFIGFSLYSGSLGTQEIVGIVVSSIVLLIALLIIKSVLSGVCGV